MTGWLWLLAWLAIGLATPMAVATLRPAHLAPATAILAMAGYLLWFEPQHVSVVGYIATIAILCICALVAIAMIVLRLGRWLLPTDGY